MTQTVMERALNSLRGKKHDSIVLERMKEIKCSISIMMKDNSDYLVENYPLPYMRFLRSIREMADLELNFLENNTPQEH
jgi:hypothetical protein